MQDLVDHVKAAMPNGTPDAIAKWIAAADRPADLKFYALNAAFTVFDWGARSDLALACCDKLSLIEVEDQEFALRLQEWVASVRFQLLLLTHRSEQARAEAFRDLANYASDLSHRGMLSSALRRAQELFSHKTSESKVSSEAWLIHAELAKAGRVTAEPVALANRVCALLIAAGAIESALDGYTLTLQRLNDSSERDGKSRALFARAELLCKLERFDETLPVIAELLGRLLGVSDESAAALRDSALDLHNTASAQAGKSDGQSTSDI